MGQEICARANVCKLLSPMSPQYQTAVQCPLMCVLQDLSVDPTIARHVQVVVKKYEESKAKAPTYPVPIYLPKHPPELHLREWGRIEREWARQAHLRHDGKRNKAPKLTSFYSIVMLLLGVVRFLRTRMRFITQRQKVWHAPPLWHRTGRALHGSQGSALWLL